MEEVTIATYIKTTLTRAGDGKEEPVRIITQWWDFDGNLLFEYDPHKEGTLIRVVDAGMFTD